MLSNRIEAPETPDFLRHEGQAGHWIAGFDWSHTALGPISRWPQSLKSAVGILVRSPVPIVMLWGADGYMIYNDSYAEFAGGRHPQALGSKVREGWPEVADFNDHVMKTGLAGGTLSYRDQELTLLRNGRPEQVWMNLDYSPVLDESGKPAGVIAIVVETTSRVTAERQLAAENARLAQMFEQGPSFLAMLSGPEHQIEFANTSYRKLVGGRDVVGKTVAEALPEVAGQGYIALLDQVYRSGTAFSSTGASYTVQATPDGPAEERFVDFVYQPIRDAAGAVTGIFVDGVDVTDRMEGELALREANAMLEARVLERTAELQAKEARLRTIFETSYQFQGMIATDGMLLDSNGTSLTAIGCRLSDVAGLSFWDTPWFTGTEGAPEKVRAAIFAAAEGRTVHEEMQLNLPQGGWRWFNLTIRPLRDAEGEVLAVIAEAAEFTEQRQAEEALRQSQKMEAVGQLTGGLAHDFNNLLTGVLGSLEIMEIRMAQGRVKELDRYITVAQGAAKRAAALTHRLLAFSRRQTLDPKPTDVNRLVLEMDELVRRSMGPQIAVEVVTAAGLWATLVDPNQLENALLNLCINARDAMPDGGRLTIETCNRWLDDRAAHERDLTPGQYISLCVSDTGSGMPPDVVSRAFDPFFTTKPIGEGTGLGLSMVYGFARQSGGQVRIYSEVDGGTMVCVYLPRLYTQQEREAESLTAPPVEPTHDGETVLVVDDEPAVRMLVVEALSDLGYVAMEAEDGPSAMKILRTDKSLDLLITDVGLPGGTNGRQLADAARVGRPNLKVLFITGYAENAAIGNGQLTPGMHVLTKPFTMDALSRRIKQVFADDVRT